MAEQKLHYSGKHWRRVRFISVALGLALSMMALLAATLSAAAQDGAVTLSKGQTAQIPVVKPHPTDSVEALAASCNGELQGVVSLDRPSCGLAPAITMTKTVGTDPNVCATTGTIDIQPGTEVTYCYYVSNIGDVTLTRHDLDDSELGSIFSDLPYSLTPGASVFITQSTTINASTINTATWTAFNPGPSDLATAMATATVNVILQESSIALTKTVGLGPNICATSDTITVDAGTTVVYCFDVVNTGNITQTLHDLVDSELGTILSGFGYTLSPGASVFLTQTAIITGTTVNSASWTAYNPGPADIATAMDSATVNVMEVPIHLPIIIKP